MIKLFKNNILLQIIIILAVALVSWLMTMHSVTMPTPIDSAPLYNLLYTLLSPYPIASSCIAMVLVLGEGLLLTAILNDHKMIAQNTVMPMLFFVTTMATNGFSLNPILLVNLTILIIIRKILLKGTLLTISFDTIISAAAWIAIASMFFLPAILLLVPFVLSFTIYNIYNWRCWAMTILGLLAPYIIYFAVLFIGGLSFQIPTIDWDQFLSLFQFSTTKLLEGIYFIIAIWGVFSILESQRERVVVYRKNTSLVLISVWSSFLMSVFVTWQDNFSGILQLFAMPFAYALSLLFLNAKGKKWIWESLFLITIAIPIITATCNL